MATRNAKVWMWFDGGHIVDALLGKGDYFIAGVTYRDRHDDVLVLNQLADWAIERDRWDESTEAVGAAIGQAKQAGDLRAALGIAWAALLVGDNRHERLLEESMIRSSLDEAIDDEDGEVQALARALFQRLPAGPEHS